MKRSPTQASDRSDRRLDRNKGLARISALTMGAGAAGLVGAVAIAVTLPGSAAVSQASRASGPNLTSGSTISGASSNNGSSDDGSSDDGSSDDGSTTPSQSQAQLQAQVQAQAQLQAQAQAQSQLRPGTAPSTSNKPPAATSGAS
ncbi:MAG: hypothetical protein ABI438_04205 [Dermatophilaceae bacterium]